MNAEKITLLDYANDRDSVVAFFTSTAQPTGEHVPIGHPDMDFADRRGLLDLQGTIDSDGQWSWDGKGKPTDDRSCRITSLVAFNSVNKWADLVAEYESEG